MFPGEELKALVKSRTNFPLPFSRWISYYISKGWTSVLAESLLSLNQKLFYAGTHVIIWDYWTEAMQEKKTHAAKESLTAEICFIYKGHRGGENTLTLFLASLPLSFSARGCIPFYRHGFSRGTPYSGTAAELLVFHIYLLITFINSFHSYPALPARNSRQHICPPPFFF